MHSMERGLPYAYTVVQLFAFRLHTLSTRKAGEQASGHIRYTLLITAAILLVITDSDLSTTG
jgi:hypothetical protein